MKKVIVIGCPGGGKSTFARRLQKVTGLPIYHLDMIWHKPDRTTVSREAFDCRLGEILKTPKWIIDGNYGRTLDMRLKECDTVFLLDLPVDVCLAGAQARIGKKRPDMPWVEEEMDEEFKEWILNFAQNEMPAVYTAIEKYADKQIFVFRSREEIDAFWIEDRKG